MRQGFNQVKTPDHFQSRLRRSRLLKAGVALASMAAVAAGCGQSSGQHSASGVQPRHAATQPNTAPNPNTANSGTQTTTSMPETGSSSNVPPITDVCGVAALKELTAKLFGYPAVECVPERASEGGALLRYQPGADSFLAPGTADVTVDQGHATFDGWSTPAIAAIVHPQKAPDINGNPALFSEGRILTIYGDQQLSVDVYPPGPNDVFRGTTVPSNSQIEQFDLQAAKLIEDNAGH